MRSPRVESYLNELAVELGRRAITTPRFLEEVEGHLADAVESGRLRGLSLEAAERDALDRFGQPSAVAETFASGRLRTRHAILVVLAVAMGIFIAYVDSRQTWDDTGITAFAMLAIGALLSMFSSRRPWLLALAVGVWIPAHAIVSAPAPGSFAMLVVLVFPFAGAYAGTVLRRLATG
jgi:hypothetical protein